LQPADYQAHQIVVVLGHTSRVKPIMLRQGSDILKELIQSNNPDCWKEAEYSVETGAVDFFDDLPKRNADIGFFTKPSNYFSRSTNPLTNQRCISSTTRMGGSITSSEPAMATFQ
jgi:hypothetical protein